MSTLKVDNIQNRVGTGAPTLTYGATIPSGQNLTIGGDLTVTGNFTVSGTTTTVNTTNTTVQDTLLELNSGASSNANDLGLILERGSTGDNAAIIWDESADKFALGTTTSDGSATGNLTLTTGTLVANLEGSQSGGSVSATTITGSSDLAINTSTLFVDVSGNSVGIRTSAPGFPASYGASSNTVANTAFDIAYSGAGANPPGVPNLTMLIGADTGGSLGAATRTDNTTKEFRIRAVHYDTSALPMNVMQGAISSGQNALSFGHGTSSMNTPTEIRFKVNDSTTVSSSANDEQLLLKGLTSGSDTFYARLELKNSGFSESCNGQFSTSVSGSVAIDCSQGTVFARKSTGNVTTIDLANVDNGQNRVHTVTILFFNESGGDLTVASTNGVSINGATAQDLRFSGGSDGTLKNGKINMLTIVCHTDSGSNKRVFATLVNDL
jgi:hypothetical protein